MSFFDKFKKKEELLPTVQDTDIVAVCSGKLIPANEIQDPVFSEEMMGQTIAIEPTSEDIVAPVNGTIEALFPTKHAFGIKMMDGTGLLIHIGINTVNMNGDGFKVYKKQGDKVKAGEKIISVDFNKVKAAGNLCTTMIIVTDPVEGKEYNYIDFGDVEKYQKINK